jgi:hypothetical protein
MGKYIVLGRLLLFAFAVILLAWVIVWFICYNARGMAFFDQIMFGIFVATVGYGMAIFIILMTGSVGFLVKRRRDDKDGRWGFFWFMIFGIVLTVGYCLVFFI